MKSVNLILLLLILTISPFLHANSSNYSSVYTSLKDCQVVESSERSSSQECPGKENYRVFHQSGDTRSWLVIKKGDDVVIDLFQPIMQNAPGNFAHVSGKVAEWRYQGKTPIALIFRIAGTEEILQQGKATYKEKTKLLVVRLEDNRACVIGATAFNHEARKISDGQPRCVSNSITSVAHLSGQYQSRGKDFRGDLFRGELELQVIGQLSAKFKLFVAAQNGCSGEIDGKLVFVDTTNATSTAAGCELGFTFGDNNVKITEGRGCYRNHGLYCRFSNGIYNKK